jgi:hypothetical protein
MLCEKESIAKDLERVFSLWIVGTDLGEWSQVLRAVRTPANC